MAFVDAHREAHGIEPICRQLAIAPSTYYRHEHQQATPTARSARAQRDDALRVAIRRVWDTHLQVYGPRKVWKQLQRDGGKWADLGDVRTSRLGTIVEDLSRVEPGPAGHVDFERWVLTAVKILFNKVITNVQLKVNPAATQQRDVVGTIVANAGLWRRVRDDYGTRQIIFECKNYKELEPDDFRQVLSYLTGEYGRFAVVVTRTESEVPSPSERAWIRTMYAEHQQRLILIVPADVLARCIKKLRNPNRLDYTDDVLSKRMDTFVRSYLNIPSAKRFRKKKPKAGRRP